MPSGNPTGEGGLGAGGGGGSAGAMGSAIGPFSAANHYAGVAGDLRGEVAGFAVSAVIRQLSYPTTQGAVVSNQNLFQATGGWYLGIDGNRFKFGLAQATDSTVIDNFVSADLPADVGGLLNRLFVLTMNYDGTDCTLYVNGEDAFTLTPASGYAPADIGQQPYVGRNANGGAPGPADGSGFLGFGYHASALTVPQIGDHVRACINAGTFANDLGAGSPFTSHFPVPAGATSPATLSDSEGVAGDFTRAGSVAIGALPPIW